MNPSYLYNCRLYTLYWNGHVASAQIVNDDKVYFVFCIFNMSAMLTNLDIFFNLISVKARIHHHLHIISLNNYSGFHILNFILVL